MSDAEIVRLLAEKTMGWEQTAHLILEQKNHPEKRFFSVASETGQVWYPRVFSEWNPLTSDADSWAVLDKMMSQPVTSRWGFALFVDERGESVEANFSYCDPNRDSGSDEVSCRCELEPYNPENRRRAIAIAALKACGAWEAGE